MGHTFLCIGAVAEQPAWLATELARAGHSSVPVPDVASGVARARNTRPTAIILCRNAAAAHTYNELALLHLQSSTAALPLVMLSPAVPPAAVVRALRSGASEVLVVPAESAVVMQSIRVALGEGPLSPAARGAADRSGPAILRRVGAHLTRLRGNGVLSVEGGSQPVEITFTQGAVTAVQYGQQSGGTELLEDVFADTGSSWQFVFREREVAPGASPAPPPKAATTPAAAPAPPTAPSPPPAPQPAPTAASAADPNVGVPAMFDLAAAFEPLAPPPRATAAQLDAVPPLRVLVADDDDDLRRMYRARLQHAGMLVSEAPDGVQAYKVAQEARPDLILCDIMMPQLDGWGVLRLMREDARLREVTFILNSCHGEYLRNLESHNVGADAYLEKGMKLEELVATVQAVAAPRRNALAALRPMEPFAGRLSDVGTQRLLAALTDRGATGKLTITSGVNRTELILDRGLTRQVTTQGATRLTGQDALLAVMTTDEGEFHYTPGAFPADPTVGFFFTEVRDALCATLNARKEKARQALLEAHAVLRFRDHMFRLYQSACVEQVRPLLDAMAQGTPPAALMAAGNARLVEWVVHDLVGKGVAELMLPVPDAAHAEPQALGSPVVPPVDTVRGEAAALPPAVRRKAKELLALALHHSAARDVVGGRDAVREVVEWNLARMAQPDGSVSLQPLWELFKKQPGFSEEDFFPALCRFKTWEAPLGAQVQLPDALQHLDAAARDFYAGRCVVSEDELLHALDPAMRPARVRTTPAPQPVHEERRRTNVALILSAVAAVSLLVSVVGSYNSTAEELPPAVLTLDIPLATVRVGGGSLELRLMDDAWLHRPEEERTAALVQALEKARRHGANRMAILGEGGKVVATVVDLNGTVEVHFFVDP